jgi:hypothetical protein
MAGQRPRTVANGYAQPVAIVTPFNPVGAHTTDTTVSTATTITRPDGGNRLLMQCVTQNIRYTLDGTTPTASVGFRLAAGDSVEIVLGAAAVVKVIEETASAVVGWQWAE